MIGNAGGSASPKSSDSNVSRNTGGSYIVQSPLPNSGIGNGRGTIQTANSVAFSRGTNPFLNYNAIMEELNRINLSSNVVNYNKEDINSNSFNNVNINQNGKSTDGTIDLAANNYNDGKLIFKKDGTICAGNQQIYFKAQNGKYYIVDNNGNYIKKSDGKNRVINPSGLNPETRVKVENYVQYGNTMGVSSNVLTNTTNNVETLNSNNNSGVLDNVIVKNNKSKNENILINSNVSNPSKKISSLISNDTIEFKDDGTIRVGNNQVFLKEENGKYYVVDYDGNYVHTSDGAKRTVNPNFLSASARKKIENYNTYGYTFGNAQPIADKLAENGYNLSSVSKNINMINGTTIFLTNGQAIDINNMSSNEIYDAVKTNGLSINRSYQNYDSFETRPTDFYNIDNINTNGIITSGASAGRWTNKPEYVVELGGADHRPNDHALSQKEYDLLCYVCMHEGLNNPEQVSATASTILNGWEKTDQTFSQYVAQSCAHWSGTGSRKEGTFHPDNFGKQEAAIATGNYDVRSPEFKMSNGNDLNKATGTTFQVVNTILGGNRTTNATQWSSAGGGVNKYTQPIEKYF